MDETDRQIAKNGYAMIPNAFTEAEVRRLAAQLAQDFQSGISSVRHRDGEVYAVRNVLQLSPVSKTIWQTPLLTGLLNRILGNHYGLVRGLYFDKPPSQTWALPWHKDLLIAVNPESVKSESYSKPRLRLGVPHCEPPAEVLESMLTLRIHLDDMTPGNGPLEVMPGTHRTGKRLQMRGYPAETLTCRAGDVLAIRPLVVHSSGRSQPEATSHRRILHLEFSGMAELPEGARWWEFHPTRKN